MAQTIELSSIGKLDRISQGGQGVVYKAPNVATPFSRSMVFKEYHDGNGDKDVLSKINIDLCFKEINDRINVLNLLNLSIKLFFERS